MTIVNVITGVILGAFAVGVAIGWYGGRWHLEEIESWRPSMVPVRDRGLVVSAPVVPLVRRRASLPATPSGALLFDQDGIA